MTSAAVWSYDQIDDLGTLWSEISGGSVELREFERRNRNQAFRYLARQLDGKGKFYCELDLGFAMLQSEDARQLSRQWEKLCVPARH